MIQISYMTKRGAWCVRTAHTNAELERVIRSLHRQRLACRAEDKDGNLVGAVWHDPSERPNWRWMFDSTALTA